MSEKGAASPGRWHDVQFAKTIGATCSLKVTGACALGTASWVATAVVTARALNTVAARSDDIEFDLPKRRPLIVEPGGSREQDPPYADSVRPIAGALLYSFRDRTAL